MKKTTQTKTKKVPKSPKSPKSPKNPKAKKKKVEYYVDPKEYKRLIVEFYTSEDMTDELAEMTSKIANRLAYAPNFINYTYREEMVGDAIIKMFSALRGKKFKIDSEYNPFSYFTKIAFNAFCNRIKKEKKNRETLTNYQTEMYTALEELAYVPASGQVEDLDAGDTLNDSP